jgi:hypothetical protein
MTAARTASGPHVQAAAALARALRGRGLVAEQSAGKDGTARVLIITPVATRLAEQICVTGDAKPWFWRSGQPLCPADDISAAADTITTCPPLRTVLEEGNGR